MIAQWLISILFCSGFAQADVQCEADLTIDAETKPKIRSRVLQDLQGKGYLLKWIGSGPRAPVKDSELAPIQIALEFPGTTNVPLAGRSYVRGAAHFRDRYCRKDDDTLFSCQAFWQAERRKGFLQTRSRALLKMIKRSPWPSCDEMAKLQAQCETAMRMNCPSVASVSDSR